eukprot:m.25930 g.25930  ORF g.25930 m.25930 type:complete len:90 (-) comp5809_c0_seq2:3840-4109(-)
MVRVVFHDLVDVDDVVFLGIGTQLIPLLSSQILLHLTKRHAHKEKKKLLLKKKMAQQTASFMESSICNITTKEKTSPGVRIRSLSPFST